MNPNLRQCLMRTYYLSEALAYYECYYAPMLQSVTPHDLKHRRSYLKRPGRSEDRPLTWVPLVFHCTDFENFRSIVETGAINRSEGGYVSLTEMPLGELDRMKVRLHNKRQVAIAFSRRYIESLGFSSVLYLQHNDALRIALEVDGGLPEKLRPFVELNDDLSAFQEIRTDQDIPIKEAIWLLTTERKGDGTLDIPALETFTGKYGRIAQSYWHRTHQMGILGEWHYVKISRNQAGSLDDFRSVGEFYWKQVCMKRSEFSVRTPKDNLLLVFTIRDQSLASEFQGPYLNLDIARIAEELLLEDAPGSDHLPHRLVNAADLKSS